MAFENVRPFRLDTGGFDNALSGFFDATRQRGIEDGTAQLAQIQQQGGGRNALMQWAQNNPQHPSATQFTNALARDVINPPKADPMADEAKRLRVEELKLKIENARKGGGAGAGGATYGTTPYFTQDGRSYVTGKDGSVRFLEFPEGTKPLAPGELATEKARGVATGKAVGEAKAALPGVVQSTAETLGILDGLAADPDLDRNLGWYGGRAPDLSEGANRVSAKMAQVSGNAFLTAFQKLRGGGQITQIEGEKATAAISRLENRKQSPKAYREAITDLQRIARNGVIRAQVDAGQLPPEAMSQLHNFETLGAATPPSMAPQAAPEQPRYREQPVPQSQNPRAPGYQRNAPPAPNTTNPRAPGYQAPTRTLDAGDGFTVKVR
jgi:hypothetical protein